TISFGAFQLRPAQQLLLARDRPVEIGSRALDLLIALVERPGEVVTKEELFARVWPDTVVDESNLRAQIAALRKALGDGRRGAGYLVTVPGRGYRFVAAVARGAPALARAKGARNNLPLRLTRPIGRSQVVSAVAERVQRRRFVTIVGPGGIGKTTVALAAAESLAGEYPDGVCFVDLAPVAEERLVPGALAVALGFTAASDEPQARALAELAGRRL